ncbi:MAG: phosphatase PAP2 family protein [bacterium]
MRRSIKFVLTFLLAAQPALAQVADTSGVSKTFLNRRDLAYTGIALAATGVLSYFDPQIARAAQRSRRFDPGTGAQLDGLSRWSTKISKVNETTLTLGGIVVYGAGRLFHAPTVTDVALHATESVVLASLASQLIRGPLGRTRPYVSHDSDQYKFKPGRGFFGDSSFDYRAFPSIHTSSSMAVATVLTMEINRRHPDATPYAAPLLYAAGMLPGLARIKLDQHWASDVLGGAFMGVLSGYKVVSYSHAHPNNWFDRTLLTASVVPESDGRMVVMLSPTF